MIPLLYFPDPDLKAALKNIWGNDSHQERNKEVFVFCSIYQG